MKVISTKKAVDCSYKKVSPNSETVFDIFQQVFAGFETDAEANGRIWHGHLGTLFGREEAEDGGGGMNG